jgi:phthalate 4,5-dioxygenase oxygenase subunit
MMPAFSTAGSTGAAGTNPVNIKIPVDDERSVFFRMVWSEQELTPDLLQEYEAGNRQFPSRIPGSYLALSHKGNDYLVDREKQRLVNYTGMDPYPVQDLAMVEDQRGRIADRSHERLVASDRYLIHIRRRLIDAAKALQAGTEPEAPWRPDAYGWVKRVMVVDAEEYGLKPRREAAAIEV